MSKDNGISYDSVKNVESKVTKARYDKVAVGYAVVDKKKI